MVIARPTRTLACRPPTAAGPSCTPFPIPNHYGPVLTRHFVRPRDPCGAPRLMVGDSVCYSGTPAFNRAIYVVKTDARGNEQWHAQLGDLGWNYGKFGATNFRFSRASLRMAMRRRSRCASPLLAVVLSASTSSVSAFIFFSSLITMVACLPASYRLPLRGLARRP